MITCAVFEQQLAVKIALVDDQCIGSLKYVQSWIPTYVKHPIEMFLAHLKEVFVQEPLNVIRSQIRGINRVEAVPPNCPAGRDA